MISSIHIVSPVLLMNFKHLSKHSKLSKWLVATAQCSETDSVRCDVNFTAIFMFTLPETNSSHLKMNGWNTSFLLGWPIFRCYVCFGEVIFVFICVSIFTFSSLLFSSLLFSSLLFSSLLLSYLIHSSIYLLSILI